MMGFEYKGIDSSIYGIICKSVSRPLLPAVRMRTAIINGRSGVYDFGGGDYETRQITMHIFYAQSNIYGLRAKSREISAWLSSSTWARLIIGDEPDKYYAARVVNGVDFKSLLATGEADITFECQPFAYMATDTGNDPTWEEADFPWITNIPWNMVRSYQFTATGTKNFTFDNPGTQEIGCNSPQGSKFNLIVSGNWTTLAISLNGKTIEYTEAGSGTLIIDNVEMEVKLDGVNKLSKLDGDIDSFLIAIPGENTIEINGTGLNVNVTIDFTPIWL